jgi:hypothetical protein
MKLKPLFLSVFIGIAVFPAVFINTKPAAACPWYKPFCKQRIQAPSIPARSIPGYDELAGYPNIKIYSNKEFTEDDRRAIRRGYDALWVRLNENYPAIFSCSKRYNDNPESGDYPTALQRLKDIFLLGGTNRRPIRTIIIDKLTPEENNITGRAVPASATRDEDIYIKLSSNFLNIRSNWETAGTMAHEVLHTSGFNHPKINNDDFKPILGNTTYQVGWCIERGGAERTQQFNLNGTPTYGQYVD